MIPTTTPLTNGTPSRNGHATAPLPPFVDGAGPTAPAEGRNANGRFAKGWKGGPGNPFAREVARLRAALVRAIDADKMTRLAHRLYEQALEGNVQAAELLLRYCIGRATPAVDPDDLDNDEWRRLRDVPSREEFTVSKVTGIDTAAAIEKMQSFREQSDPFDKSMRAIDTQFVHEIAAQRKRRK
jgi:hypothetical protein